MPAKAAFIGIGLLLEGFALSAHAYAPYWLEDYALMSHCMEVEKADSCLSRSIEKAFDRGGCAQAAPWIEEADRKARNAASRISQRLFDTSSFYFNFCSVVDSRIPLAERRRKLDLDSVAYGKQALAYYSFYQTLLALQEKDLDAARQLVAESAAGTRIPLESLSTAGINLLYGQALALCQIKAGKECEEKAQEIRAKIPPADSLPTMAKFGTKSALEAWNSSKLAR